MAFGCGFSIPAFYGAASGLGMFASASLYLDFTSGNQTLDPRITFSRGSNATRTNSAGLIAYAPHNLLTYSEQFDNAAWTKNLTPTVTANNVVAPNGTTTADTINGTAGGAGVFQAATVPNGATLSLSYYIKYVSGGDIRLGFGGGGGITNFRPSTGQVISTSGIWTSTAVQTLANGWYRVSMTGVSTATSYNVVCYADVSAEFAVWGAQLNVGALQPYYPTTVKNLLGYTQEFDNAAWTKSNSFVQTNLLTWSEQFDNAAWLKVRSSITQNAATAPDGAATADKLVIDTTAATNHNTGQNITVVSGATYTLSVYVKAAEFSQINLRFSAQFPAGNTTFDLSTETKTNFGTVVDSSIDPVGGGWYRCTFTQTANASGTATAQVFLAQGGSITIATANGTDGIYLWGAQLVQGATAGDVVATYGTAKAVMYQAPDGTMSADKLVENIETSTHGLTVNPATINGTSYTFSIFAKKGERNLLRVGMAELQKYGVFDLNTGTVQYVDTGITASIADVGNGWYRCSTIQTANITGSPSFIYRIQSSTTEWPGSGTYTGDGTSGIYIWGAQLSDSASLDPYVYNPQAAPNASAYYGPRFDYDPVTLQPKGLLIEEQRTNLLTYSEQFDNAAWTKQAGGVTANSTISPDGTTTADTYTASAVTGIHAILQTAAALASGRVASVYVKAGTHRYVQISFNGDATAWANFDVIAGAGVVGSVGKNQTASIIDSGNGWYRCVVYTDSTTATNFYFSVVDSSESVRQQSWAASGTESVYIWGAQLEVGAFATSYIPTTTAQATRAADVATMTGANFSSWYRQDEGTLFAECAVGSITASGLRLVAVDDGTQNNVIRFLPNYFQVITGGAAQASLSAGSFADSVFVKQAGAYKTNDFAACASGISVATDATGSIPAVDRMLLGQSSGVAPRQTWIKRIAYFNKRLSNTELQALTS